MFYSYRSAIGYRTDPQRSYRLGYAESTDGSIGREKTAKWNHQVRLWLELRNDRVLLPIRASRAKYLFYNWQWIWQVGFGYAILVDT